MKKNDKSSQNKSRQSDDELIYILLLFLIVLLVGGGIWWWHKHEKQKNNQTPTNYDYEAKLGKLKTAPSVKELSKFLADNHGREKSIRYSLISKNRKRPVPTELKKRIEQELDANVNLASKLNELDVSILDDQTRAGFYAQLYEMGKIMVRLEHEVSEEKTAEELNEQLVVQQNWKISDSEEEEIKDNLNKWMKGWYDKFMTEELRPEQGEVKLKEFIKARLVEGQKVKKTTPAHITQFKAKDENRIYRQPLEVIFEGYGGFTTSKDSENSTEGADAFGITDSGKNRINIMLCGARKGDPNYQEWEVEKNNQRLIQIRLKKEQFFNRLGYDEWLTGVKDNDRNRTYYSIHFGNVVETIAHELAHAVVQSIRGEYEGEGGGGHGKDFYNFLDRIETMMRKTPEFAEFENWWNAPKNNK